MVRAYPSPYDRLPVDGCAWPISVRWTVPADTQPGLYLARFRFGDDRTWVAVAVRPRVPPTAAGIVCQLSTNTYQAYNLWGGKSLYGDMFDPGRHDTERTVSYHRPCQLWDFIQFESQLLAWMENHYPGVHVCTNWDLHHDPDCLRGYQLFISIGHDEYWSAAMRDRLEAWVKRGGNALFLSGNSVYRPVKFATIGGTSSSHQITSGDTWRSLSRPESETIGGHFSCGRWNAPVPRRGYTVRRPWHWLFDGVADGRGRPIAEGGVVGEGPAAGIIGYECDAVPWTDANGWPLSDPDRGGPVDFAILATAELPEWADTADSATRGPYRSTIGYFRRGQGIVFQAGTTGWGAALGLAPVDRMTRNLVDHLRVPSPLRGGAFYATSPRGELRFYCDRHQDGTGDIGSPAIIGREGWNDFRLLTTDGSGTIYAVSPSGQLRRYVDAARDGTGDLRDPVIVGSGWNDRKFICAAGDGVLYSVTSAGQLLFHRQLGTAAVDAGAIIGRSGWNELGWVCAGGNGILYATTTAGELRFYRDRTLNGTGDIGHGSVIGLRDWQHVRNLMCLGGGRLYGVLPGGTLAFWRDWARDGRQEVMRWQTVGRRDWLLLPHMFGGPQSIR